MSSNVRKSNYEMIRIVAMVLIIFHHIFVHCINEQIINPDICEISRLFNDFTIHKRLVIADYACAFGKIGNILFVMLSGYFLIDKRVDISKRIIKVITEMFFTTIVLIIASCIQLRFERIKSAMNIRVFNSEWWFAGYYIAIVLIAWLGLNDYVAHMKKERYKSILLILFAVISIGWTRAAISKTGLDGIATGVLLYLFGGYIRLYDPFRHIKLKCLTIILLLDFLLMGVSYYLYTSNNINSAILGNQESYKQVINEYGDYSIVCLIAGTALFEMMRRCKIRYSRVINYVASATFIIYLIHDNMYMYAFFYKINWVDIIYKKEYLKLVLVLALVEMSIFIGGIVLFAVYSFAIKRISSIFSY